MFGQLTFFTFCIHFSLLHVTFTFHKVSNRMILQSLLRPSNLDFFTFTFLPSSLSHFNIHIHKVSNRMFAKFVGAKPEGRKTALGDIFQSVYFSKLVGIYNLNVSIIILIQINGKIAFKWIICPTQPNWMLSWTTWQQWWTQFCCSPILSGYFWDLFLLRWYLSFLSCIGYCHTTGGHRSLLQHPTGSYPHH